MSNKTSRFAPVAIAALIAVSGFVIAGPLNPPVGTITSTGKTLTEVEPRIAINATNTPGDADATFVISQPGSYYLTGNLTAANGKHGIQVMASNVTIDLNGFVLQGSGAGATMGIADTRDELNTQRALKVQNGKILGFHYGILMEWIGGVQFEHLRLETTGDGISINGSGSVQHCVLGGPGSASSSFGVNVDGPASISDIQVFGYNLGINASSGAIRNSLAQSCAIGIRVGELAESCTTEQCSVGIDLDARATVRGCTINSGDIGIRITGMQSVASGNSITSTSQAGIRVESTNIRVENNTITGNSSTTPSAWGINVPVNFNNAYIDGNVIRAMGGGIRVDATNCVVVRNSASPLTAGASAYQIVTGNRFGPLVKAVNGGAATVTGNSAGMAGSFATTDPNSNLFW